MVNVGIRSEELSGKLPPDFHPICLDASSRLFPVWNGTLVVVDRRLNSLEKSRWIDFRCDEARILGSALGEFAVNELALPEFRCPEITSRECRTLERDMTKESSPEHTTFEITVLKF